MQALADRLAVVHFKTLEDQILVVVEVVND